MSVVRRARRERAVQMHRRKAREPKTFKQGKEIGRYPTRSAAASQIAELESAARREAAIAAAKELLGV